MKRFLQCQFEVTVYTDFLSKLHFFQVKVKFIINKKPPTCLSGLGCLAAIGEWIVNTLNILRSFYYSHYKDLNDQESKSYPIPKLTLMSNTQHKESNQAIYLPLISTGPRYLSSQPNTSLTISLLVT